MLAMMGIYAINSGQSTFSETNVDILFEARRLAERAVQSDDNNALAHVSLGRVNDLLGNTDVAIAECKNAVELNPNLAIAHHELGMVQSHSDELEEAACSFNEAIRLSPNDPSRWNFFLIRGRVLFQIGQYEEAILSSKEASRLRTTAYFPFVFLAACYVELRQMEEAAKAVTQVLARQPNFTCTTLRGMGEKFNMRRFDTMIENCRKAGLPE